MQYQDDTFLIVGGFYDASAIDTIYYYNPTVDAWELKEQTLDDSRGWMAAFMVNDQYVDVCD